MSLQKSGDGDADSEGEQRQTQSDYPYGDATLDRPAGGLLQELHLPVDEGLVQQGPWVFGIQLGRLDLRPVVDGVLQHGDDLGGVAHKHDAGVDGAVEFRQVYRVACWCLELRRGIERERERKRERREEQ